VIEHDASRYAGDALGQRGCVDDLGDFLAGGLNPPFFAAGANKVYGADHVRQWGDPKIAAVCTCRDYSDDGLTATSTHDHRHWREILMEHGWCCSGRAILRQATLLFIPAQPQSPFSLARCSKPAQVYNVLSALSDKSFTAKDRKDIEALDRPESIGPDQHKF